MNLRIDDEPNAARTGELQDDCIDPGEMIRQQQKTTAGKPFRTMRGYTINTSRHGMTDAPDEAFGQGESRGVVHAT